MGRRGGIARAWTQDPAGRRARILTAATAIFAEHGYRRTRVTDIARAAEVAEGTIFHLFGSKRELLVAVGDAYGQGMVEAAFGATAPTSRLDDVPSIIHRIFDYVARSSGPLVAFLLASDPAEGALAQAANRTRMLDAIEAVVRRGMARGEISRRDPRVAAALQFGVVESALRDCFLYHAGRDREQYAQETIRCLVAYLRA